MMGKDNNNGLIGVALGALIVGTTLALRDIFEDPKNREAVRTTIKNGYDKVKGGVQKGYATAKTKIGEGYAVAKTKIGEGYAVAKTKVGEGYAVVKDKATEGYTVAREKVQGGIAAVREKAEETGKDIAAAVENNEAVKKIKEKVEDIRRATADPIEEYFREDLTVEDASAEAPASETTAVWDTPAE